MHSLKNKKLLEHYETAALVRLGMCSESRKIDVISLILGLR